MVYFGDSETLKKFHCTCFIDEEGKEYLFKTGHEVKAFFDALGSEDIIVSKNGIGYDFFIWRHMYQNPYCTTEELREVNDDIIVRDKYKYEKGAVKHYDLHSEWFKAQHIDLQELLNTRASLKRLGAVFGYPDVKESTVDFALQRALTPDEEQEMITYCFSDCKTNRFIYERKETQTEIETREMMEEIFGVRVFGLGRPRAVSHIMNELCIQKTGRSLWDLREAFHNPPKRLFHFGRILTKVGKNSAIKFGEDSDVLNEFRSNLLKFSRPIEAPSIASNVIDKLHCKDEKKGNPLKSITEQFKVVEGKRLDIRVPIAGKVYRFKEGGIHGEEKDVVYHTNERNQLYDVDFTAFYPKAKQFFKIFCTFADAAGFSLEEFYSVIVDKNIELKGDKKQKGAREVFKIFSNLYYGLHGDPYSPIRDDRLRLKICLTGQLILLKLIEECEKGGIEVVYANTDGIAVSCPRGLKDKLHRILNRFTKGLQIPIEPVPVESMYISDTNNYLWRMDGWTKTKGKFSDFVNAIKHTIKFPIVQNAVDRYLMDGVPVEDTIRECKDPLKFCIVVSAKSSTKFNFTTPVDIHTNDIKVPTARVTKTGKPVMMKKNAYKVWCKDFITTAYKGNKHPEYAIRIKEQFLKFDKKAKVLPNVLRYYIPIEENGYPLYNLTYRSTSDLQKGKITTHTFGECAKLMLALPDVVPNDVNYQAYIDMAKDLIGDWSIRPLVQFELDVADIIKAMGTVSKLVEA